jgi:hypothetical protein
LDVKSCDNCGSDAFWKREDGTFVCEHCGKLFLAEPEIWQLDLEPKSSRFWGRARGLSRVMIVILFIVLLIPLWAALYFLFAGLVNADNLMLSYSASLFVIQLFVATGVLLYWTVDNFFVFGFTKGTKSGCLITLLLIIAFFAALVLCGLYLPVKN